MNKKKIIKPILIILICIIAEIIISNYTAIRLSLSGVKPIDIDFTDQNVVLTGEKSTKTKDCITLSDGELFINDVNVNLKNVGIEFDGDNIDEAYMNITFLDDNFAYEDGYEYNSSRVTMYTGKTNYINCQSFGEAANIRISLEGGVDKVKIDKIMLNTPPAFRFAALRAIFIAAIIFVVAYKLWKIKLKSSDYFIFKFIAAVLSVFTLMSVGLMTQGELLDEYATLYYDDADQYTQLFESFKSGRLDLDIDADTDEFEKLDNPLDRSERDEKSVQGEYWDRAYYKGKFYCYFGVAPVITVYYPVHILTGKVPTAELVSALECVFCIIFLSLLYLEMIKHFTKEPPLLLAVLGQIALIFGSGIFAAAMEFRFYYIAVLSGIAWTAAFLYYLIKAYYEEKFNKRILLLVLSGISAVLIVASRPTLIFYGVIALVPAIAILASKKETLKSKLSYIAAIGIPLFTGAVLIMLYNYKRFENPFEFGFNYQLTVSIAKANTFSLAMIPVAIYHYFIQQPDVKINFPHIEMRVKNLEYYGRYTYAGRTMGVFNYPITWAYFLMPMLLKKRDKFNTAFLCTFAAAPVVLAYINMCKAGSHYRYTLDIIFAVIIISVIASFYCLSKLKNISEKAYTLGYVFTSAAMLFTAYMGYLMMFANEGGSNSALILKMF